MTIPDDNIEPQERLLNRALFAIAQLETSLTYEHEASRLAIHSPHLLKSFTDLSHAIVEERDQLDALDLIAPRGWAAEELHSRVIS